MLTCVSTSFPSVRFMPTEASLPAHRDAGLCLKLLVHSTLSSMEPVYTRVPSSLPSLVGLLTGVPRVHQLLWLWSPKSHPAESFWHLYLVLEAQGWACSHCAGGFFAQVHKGFLMCLLVEQTPVCALPVLLCVWTLLRDHLHSNHTWARSPTRPHSAMQTWMFVSFKIVGSRQIMASLQLDFIPWWTQLCSLFYWLKF